MTELKNNKDSTTLLNVIYEGCGFPVRIRNVQRVIKDGFEYNDIDHEKIAKTVFEKLLILTRPWTGAEAKFVRKHTDMTQKQFGNFAFLKSHSGVCDWESSGNDLAGIPAETELGLRIRLIFEFSQNENLKKSLYVVLKEALMSSKEPKDVDVTLDYISECA